MKERVTLWKQTLLLTFFSLVSTCQSNQLFGVKPKIYQQQQNLLAIKLALGSNLSNLSSDNLKFKAATNARTSYKVIGQISLNNHNSVHTKTISPESSLKEENNLITINNDNSNEEGSAKSQYEEFIKSIVCHLFLENENVVKQDDVICAFQKNNDDNSNENELEIFGIVGCFKDNRNIEMIQKSSLAESVGCLCDLILLKLDLQPSNISPNTSTNLSDDQQNYAERILNCLVDGIQRKINAAYQESLTSTPPTRIVLVHQSSNQNKDKIEDWIKKELRQQFLNRNISTDCFQLQIIHSPYSTQRDLDLSGMIKNDGDWEKYVPIQLFPKLAQSILSSLLIQNANMGHKNYEDDDHYHLVNFTNPLLSFQQSIHAKLIPLEATKSLDVNDDHNSFSITSRLNSTSQTVATLSHETQMRLRHITSTILQDAKTKLSKLETKQDEATLRGGMPILEFGSDSSSILEQARDTFDSMIHEEQSELLQLKPEEESIIKEKRNNLICHIAYGSNLSDDNVMDFLDMNIHALYYNQLSALREYYGGKFEMILDEKDDLEQQRQGRGMNNNIDINESSNQCIEGFKTAAFHAIPTLCQLGQEFYRDENSDGGSNSEFLSFDFTTVLNGLVKDMMMILEERENIENDWASAVEDDHDDEEYESDGRGGIQKKKRLKWLRKLGSRLIVMGVNYIQGWLMYQAVKRAAAERDRNMPKFPLF